MPSNPHPRHRRSPAPARPPASPRNRLEGLSERELHELQALLDMVPPPLEPLDVVMLDGYLCGVLVQPQRLPASRWRPHVTDVDGRPLPGAFDASRLEALVARRHAQLDQAIGERQWFDPWVFELDDAGDDAVGDAVYPWVAGFATAMELFPALALEAGDALSEPLALIYRHLAADDLEDADALIAEIDALEPAPDLAAAVEGLVRATLLLADIGRPRRTAGGPGS
jgi:uncharacterized protein